MSFILKFHINIQMDQGINQKITYLFLQIVDIVDYYGDIEEIPSS